MARIFMWKLLRTTVHQSSQLCIFAVNELLV